MSEEYNKLKSSGFTFEWCVLCECVTMMCPKCEIGSCTGGGCDLCSKDHFELFKSSPEYNSTKREFETLVNDGSGIT